MHEHDAGARHPSARPDRAELAGLRATAAVREPTPSFVKMCTRCDLTVASLRKSARPMSRFVRPPATSASTSASRTVRRSSAVRRRVEAQRDAGASADSPTAAARTAAMSSAGGASFSR